MQKIVVFLEEFGVEVETVLIQNLKIILLFVFGVG
jgi:hypothetical protein